STSIEFLDLDQRYRLLEPLPTPLTSEIEVSVQDCQPFQASFTDLLDEEPIAAETQTQLAPIATQVVPALAQPYVEIWSQSPALPQIHDAIDRAEFVAVVLQDRSQLPPLLEVWSSEDVLPLQMLHWMHEMAELWGILQPLGQAQSLLKLDNLRVDEDQLLSLQRLHADTSDRPLDLRDLGQLWQQIFQQTQRTQIGSLAQLCYGISVGEIATIEQIHQRLEAIADEFQTLEQPAFDLEPPEPAVLPTAVEVQPTALELPEAEALPIHADPSASNSSMRLELADPVEDATNEGDDAPTVVLPMKLLNLEDAGRTDIGRQRERNEDYFSVQSEVKKLESPSGRSLQAKGLYILCDGMGGHAGGEVASALATDTLRQYFDTHWQDQLPKEAQIREAIHLANKAIYDLNQQNNQSGSGRMGTTLVLVLVHSTEAAIAHVGDSRLYRFSRRRGLEQITIDHEVGQREIQRGVEPSIAYARPDAYQLTQALGPRDENFINPDVQFIELNEDLILLLCSDGLTDNGLIENHWRTHLEPLLNFQNSLEQGANQLIDLANQYNGHDNITAVLIRARVHPNLDALKP
ncbi:MAG: serine/threonine phosphatase, partial [Microcoleus sp. SIO2G3]|nr:serine/threonine phosphatase [Microcoleus sp. SIO2G3]